MVPLLDFVMPYCLVAMMMCVYLSQGSNGDLTDAEKQELTLHFYMKSLEFSPQSLLSSIDDPLKN